VTAARSGSAFAVAVTKRLVAEAEEREGGGVEALGWTVWQTVAAET
jgi:hypothetical protein